MMDYQFLKELEEGVLLFEDEHKQEFVFEKIPFAVPLHDHVLREIIHDLRGFFKNRQSISCEGLIEYTTFEKYQGDLYLVRPLTAQANLTPFETVELDEACQVLLNSLKVMQTYHQQGIVLKGWSVGLIKRGTEQQIYFLDPLLFNHLQKWLDEAFTIEDTPELIKGESWSQAGDVFSWGILAYRLLTGVHPFAAATLEERLDKIINGKIIAPQDQFIGLHPELGKLVLECLARQSEARPTAEAVLTRLGELIKTKRCLLSAEEMQAYTEKATTNRQRQEFLEKTRGFWRKYKMALLVSLGILITFILLIRPGAKKTEISGAATPEEIVKYYFKSIAKLDTELMNETIYKANNTFSEMVSNLYVMNRMQQGISREFKDYIQVKVNDLQVEPIKVENSKVEYKVNYMLLITTAAEKNYIKREDQFRLQPVKRSWKITNIKIIKEKKWLKALVTPSPTATSSK